MTTQKTEDLIKIQTQKGKQIVNARELHQFLIIQSKFADWIKNRIEEYGFVENEDFIALSKNLENGGKFKEYEISLDMAKELCMVERNEKGRMARKYFIAIEKRYMEQKSLTDTELIRKAIAITGNQGKLAKRIGIAEGTMSDIINGTKSLSPSLISRVIAACNNIVNNRQDPQTLEMLLKIEDGELRLGLYNVMRKGGLL